MLIDSCPSFVFQKLSLSLQEHFSDHIDGTLQRNSLCNLLVFNYTVSSNSKTFPFNVRLLYGDLCCSLPTEAIISCTRKWAVQVSVWGGQVILQRMSFSLVHFGGRKKHAVIFLWEEAWGLVAWK